MRLPPLQISVLTEPDPKATQEAGEPRVRPRLDIVTPPGFADRQDLLLANFKASRRGGVSLIRVWCAAIGLSTRVGRESGADFAAHDCSVPTYGGEVYAYLAERGVAVTAIGEAGKAILDRIIDMRPPSEKEVRAAEGNSEAEGAGST